jgi:flagellar biosynthetic protein FliP
MDSWLLFAQDAAPQTGVSTPVQIALFLGGMAFISAGLVTLTAFTRIIIVLSFVRRALSTDGIPPNLVLIGLSMFLTLFVMRDTVDKINTQAVQPMMAGELTMLEASQQAIVPLRQFMLKETRKNDLILFLNLSGVGPVENAESIPFTVLVPSFVVSELKTAFIMGFCLFLPFILVDIVVSVVLMSLGMMMMPPVVVSTPMKLLLFVLVDGWTLVIRGLHMSFH